MSRLFLALAFLLFAVASGGAAALAAQGAPGTGVVDAVHYDPASGHLLVTGWAGTESASVFTSNIVILVGEQQIYRGRFQRLERPDVVKATGRRDWLWSGWQVEVAVPAGGAAGRHPVAIRFLLTDGEEIKIGAAAPQTLEIPARRRPSGLVMAIAALAVCLPLLAFVAADRIVIGAGLKVSARTVFGASVLVSFLLLVAVGLTGSSLRLALDGSPVVREDSIPWFGQAREIRSDEWRILTQLAIGQVNHDPPLPVVNHNVGSDGQNMLVVGMTGVPVAHLSALARPATWGFFMFDLRRALAWHWWLPFFGCFAALWLLLMRMFRIDWRLAAVLAVTMPAAPYSVAFSGHPAYALFFPVLGVLAADWALRERRMAIAALGGATLGWSIAGFALLLYPAWQISLAYVLGPFAIAAFIAHRQDYRLGRAQVVAAAVAVAVAALLLAAWWLAARDAVATIAATVYPGQRATSVGGDIDPWFLIKGLLSPVTMYADSPMMDQSDAGSFIFLLPPLAVAAVMTWIGARRVDAVAAVLLGFVALALAYLYGGFHPTLAELTLWGRTTSYRLDLALGLAQTLLLGWLVAAGPRIKLAEQPRSRMIAIVTAVATAAYALAMFRALPVRISATLSPPVILLSCLGLGVVSYLLLRQRFVPAIGIYCAWMVGTAMPFNPLSQGPTAVSAAGGLAPIAADRQPWPDQRRVAILDEHGWTVTAVAAGVPVVNTVMYYPQPSLWRALDPTGQQRTLYNRYQHLLFDSAALTTGPAHQIDSQRLDAVRVTLDPGRFDFRLLGAAWVLTAEATAAALASNTSLQKVDGRDGWVLLRVAR